MWTLFTQFQPSGFLISKDFLFVCSINPFVPNALFLYPLKITENRRGCLMFSRGGDGALGTNRLTFVHHIWLYLIISNHTGDIEKNLGTKPNSCQGFSICN